MQKETTFSLTALNKNWMEWSNKATPKYFFRGGMKSVVLLWLLPGSVYLASQMAEPMGSSLCWVFVESIPLNWAQLNLEIVAANLSPMTLLNAQNGWEAAKWPTTPLYSFRIVQNQQTSWVVGEVADKWLCEVPSWLQSDMGSNQAYEFVGRGCRITGNEETILVFDNNIRVVKSSLGQACFPHSTCT